MAHRAKEKTRRPGRPPKFGRPSRVVALTLPEDAIDRLRRIDRDLGWAIVKMLETQSAPRSRAAAGERRPDVELAGVSGRRYLIVVNRDAIRDIPGVNIIPLDGTRAFLALDIDRGLSDLELAVSDRLQDAGLDRRERRALAELHVRLRAWRHDQTLRFGTRAIIVGERIGRRTSDAGQTAAARQHAGRRARAARRDRRTFVRPKP